MVGPTLIEIRERIKSLADKDGTYYVVCGRTGDRPVPAAGKRFADRATARTAARVTEQYRSALRDYDPQVPYYDLIICQDTEPETVAERTQECPQKRYQRTLSEPVLDVSLSNPERRELVEFCHRLAGAVLETLSENGYDALESAVMDTYFEWAERVGDPDELCLCLLESLAAELNDWLDPSEQTTVLIDAGRRLEPPETTAEPLAAALESVNARGLIGKYTRSPLSVDNDGEGRLVVVRLSNYALSPNDDRLPVLPIILELSRHQPERLPRSLRVDTCDGGWQVTFVFADSAEQCGLVSVPIDHGV